MKLGRSFTIVPLGVAATLGLLLATATLGMRLRAQSDHAGLPEASSLDYDAALIGAFSPLSPAFIRDVLGGVIDTPARGGADGPFTTASGAPPVAPSRSTSIDHLATNDRFADAYEVPSVPFSARTTTTKATREDGERANCSPVGGTVWYRYVPPRDVTLIADTFGTDHSVALAAYSGSTLSSLDAEGCETSAIGNAQVTYRARAGVPYYYQVTGVARGGELRFNLQPLGSTVRVDGSTEGRTDNPVDFGGAAISGDGRYVAFVTDAAGGGCGTSESCLFVTDLVAGTKTLLLALRRSTDQSGSYMSDIDMSADGRHIAFSSPSDDLVPNDNNGTIGSFDVFVIDRITRHRERVSVSSTGEEAHTDRTKTRTIPIATLAGSWGPSISADGRFVSFNSDADNLDRDASDGGNHLYVHDRLTRRTELVSIDEHGEAVTGFHRYGRGISGDGRFIVFGGPRGVYLRDREHRRTTYIGVGGFAPVVSEGGERVAFIRTRNGFREVYVYDVARKSKTRASVASDGTAHGSPESRVVSPGSSTFPRLSLSADGRFVAFESAAPALVPHDTNGVPDVFVHDLENRTTVRVSVRSNGSEFSTDSYYPTISRDGRIVAFQNDSSARLTYAHISAAAGRP
jgi:Tol biopolymer transport system component